MKLYIVTRRDLGAPGFVAAQLCHALRQFQQEHPSVEREWFDVSNTLALLETDSVVDLERLVESAKVKGVPVAVFHEPDIGGALTAATFGPSGKSLVRHLPLALSRATT